MAHPRAPGNGDEDAAGSEPHERRPPKASVRKAGARQWARLVADSEHQPELVLGKWKCTACHSAPDQRGLRPWLATSCRPLARTGWGERLSPDGPVAPAGHAEEQPQEKGRVQVGTTALHPSHVREFYPDIGYRGIWVCRLCGVYTTCAPRAFAQECPLRPNRGGRWVLSQVAKGLLPGTNPAAKAWNESRGFVEVQTADPAVHEEAPLPQQGDPAASERKQALLEKNTAKKQPASTVASSSGHRCPPSAKASAAAKN